MTEPLTQTQDPTLDLKSRWLALKADQPHLHARDAAAQLGVTEAELLAMRCGDGVRRLTGPWGALIEGLPALGPVMALTRNDSAVHEKVGRYDKVSIFQNMGLVLNAEIDLRIFLGHWHAGFAVQEQGRAGPMRSLQFFDIDGAAVHKIYLRPESDGDAYDTLIERHLHDDQAAALEILPRQAPPADRPDSEIDATALRERWLALKDVHDFAAMLKELGAGRIQSFRLVGEDLAYRVDPGSFRSALEKAADTKTPIMIFVGNSGVIQIHTGPVQTLKAVGPWFNVLDDGFNLHLRTDQIADAWVIRKPTSDGIVTSLEIFDAEERQIALMFGQRKPSEPEREDWRGLVGSLIPLGASIQ